MRWADMDLLGHVNNVTYLDYVAEARTAVLGELAHEVRRHRIEFAAPLVYRRRPVLVDTWATEVGDERVVLAHQVYDAPQDGGERTVYLRAETDLAVGDPASVRDLLDGPVGPPHEWRPLAAGPARPGDDYALRVRRSDLGGGGRASDVAHVEYFQEARIQFLMNLHTRGQKWTQHVVARTDVDYLGPVTHRQEPYAVHSWIGHVGSRSFTIHSELRDGGETLATASVVMVTFDMETQRSADMAASQRERLEQELSRTE